MSSSEARIRAAAVLERPRLRLADPPAAAPPSPIGRALAHTNRAARVAVLALVLLAWVWLFLPQSLGGRAGWVLVSGKSMLPRYHTGDLVLVERQSRYRVGEVIAYRVPKGDPMAGAQVIHRIVGGDAVHGFVVQGDNRTAPDTWRPKPQDIVGAKVLRIPDAILVLQWLRSPVLLGLLAASFVFVRLLAGGEKEERHEAEADRRREPARRRPGAAV